MKLELAVLALQTGLNVQGESELTLGMQAFQGGISAIAKDYDLTVLEGL